MGCCQSSCRTGMWAAAAGLSQGSPTKQLSLHQCCPRAAASWGCGLRFWVSLVMAARRWAQFRLPALCQHGEAEPGGAAVVHVGRSRLCLVLDCLALQSW